MNNRKLTKNSGITLIALIITIIVMLILVSVTISMAINGGLFGNAGKAVKETQNAIDYEQELANGRIKVDGVWYDSIDDFLAKKPSPTARISLSIAGTKATTIPVPDGFDHVEGTTVDTGYVIRNTTDGNEFVWVPVEKDQKITLKITSEKDITGVKLYDPYGDEILSVADGEIKTTYNNTDINPTINGMYIAQVTTEDGIDEKTLTVKSLYALDSYNDWLTSEEFAKMMSGETLSKEQLWEDLVKQEMGAESLEAAIQSVGCNSLDQFITFMNGQEMKNAEFKDVSDYTSNVNSNGGFYIGRYEAGKETDGTPVSKEGYAPYNYVTFEQAKGLAESMYSSSSDFKVSLLTGSAWDRTLGWIYETGRKSIKEIVVDSGSWGNYHDVEFKISKGQYSEDYGSSYKPVPDSGIDKAKEKSVLLTTGATTRNAVNNIFDLAGNVSEWTNEAYSTSSRVTRGGIYSNDGADLPVTDRSCNGPTVCGGNIGFRAALYIK